MRSFVLLASAFALVLTGCASTGSQGSSSSSEVAMTSSGNGVSQGTPVAADKHNLHPLQGGVKKKPVDPDLPMPSKLVHDQSEVPVAVKRIERFINPKSGLLADEVVIEVSKNYQFDCSLTGDRVGHVLAGQQGTDRMAIGPATAYVRNLKIKADKRIRLVIADFGTKPFIRITARGRCAHVVDEGSSPKVQRSDAILIRNDRIQYLEGIADPAVASAFATRN